MPIFLLALGAGLVGLVAAAAANACLMRTRDSLAFTTRRTCSVCAVPVSPKEMLPVVGYLSMKGRCQRCKAVVPWQYLALEIAVGLLFALFALRALLGATLPPFVELDELFVLFGRDALAILLLALIFMFDYRASVIPDRLTVPGMIIAIGFNLWLGMSATEILFGGFLLGAFFAIQYLLTKGAWVGAGDIRLGLFVGFLLGPIVGLAALFISYIIGSIAGIILIASKRRDLESHIPYGTFLAVATILMMAFGQDLVTRYLALIQ